MATEPSNPSPPILIDDAPVNRFHIRMTALTFGAHFTDGYAIGSISIALSMIANTQDLSAVWQGLIASSALIGIFLGSLTLGHLSDKVGRRKIFMLNFALIVVASAAQLFVDNEWQLLVLRLLVGFGLGGDYAVGVALLAEVIPRHGRGTLLGCMNVVWNVGYVASVLVGWAIQSSHPEAWRWLLASSTIPALIVLLGRIGVPESPRWLMKMKRYDEARQIIDKYIAKGAIIDETTEEEQGGIRALFSKKYRKHTAFASLIFCANVVPFFAIYTFLPTILKLMNLEESRTTEMMLNMMLIVGALVGMWATAKLTRRQFSIGGFAICSVSLLLLAVLPSALTVPIIISFVVFSLAINALNNLNSVYPPEVMPTEVRGMGIGFATAMSRVASAIGTFFVPMILASAGLQLCMFLLALTAVAATIMCYRWAPNTNGLSLVEASTGELGTALKSDKATAA